MHLKSFLLVHTLPFVVTSAPLLLDAQKTLHGSSGTPKACDCTGTNGTDDPRVYICGDKRLGPVDLPREFPMLAVVNNYDRFGGLKPGEFLEKWTDPKSGWFQYPKRDGFLLDTSNNPIYGNATLKVGTSLDRFGSEYGKFLAEAEAPFDQRALPPANLNHDPNWPDYPNAYHVYTVIKPLTVLAGPIAPWFGQPGLGAQFYTGYTGNIKELIAMGYIEPQRKSQLDPPGEHEGKCG